MLTFTAVAVLWIAFTATVLIAVHRVTSKRFPSQPVEGPEESVFDIEDYQWQDVA